jgi:hypothetical protein
VPATDGPVPLFVVGLQRAGAVVLERMLGAHPDVADAGELHDAVVQLRWCTNRMGPPYLDVDLAEAARAIDPATFGVRYLGHTQWHARGRPVYLDRRPANALVLGFLADALPQARFLHVVREPSLYVNSLPRVAVARLRISPVL